MTMPNSARYRNIAHRGARSLAPENTMPAFARALEVGADGIETDVSVTADGELILVHDTTFNRTTNVARLFPGRQHNGLHTFRLAEIQHLDAGSWFIDGDPFGTIKAGAISPEEVQGMVGTTIPRLEELLYLIKESNSFINIELKPLPKMPKALASFALVERTLALVYEAGLTPAHFSISSFHHPFLRKIQQLRPDIEVNALIGGTAGKRQRWGNYDFPVFNANVRKTDAGQIAKARRHGCRINLYTVNDPGEMEYYMALGVEKIITDYPQLLHHLLAGHDRVE
ncbi:MAG: glycerophosphodiester phosphodiesterase [Desulfopila sp.]